MRQSGADILRLWVCSTDSWDDQRIGPEILKTDVEIYRKLRNTIRWMLGNLVHFHEEDRVRPEAMPEIERLMLHRLAELDGAVREAYREFDYKRIFAALNAFMTIDLSAFYFDMRKDALYCDGDTLTRRAARTVLGHLFDRLTTWLAPVLVFTMEEVWLERHPGEDSSVHLQDFPATPEGWREHIKHQLGRTAPFRMTDGRNPAYRDWSTGYDPSVWLDRAIRATREAAFPLHGLDPHDPRD